MFNIFIVIIVTFAIALFLIYLISSHDRKLKKRKEAARTEQEGDETAMDFRQFTKICMDICENLKLEIDDVNQLENDELIVRATSSDPITKVQFLIVCYYLHKDDTLDNNKVMEISDQIVSERLSKGIIMTTGRIDNAVKNMPEQAPMVFIDGFKLNELIEKYKINY